MRAGFLFLALSFLLACSRDTRVANRNYAFLLRHLLSHSVPEIGVDSVADPPQALLLDARSRPEYQLSHVPGAVYVGYDSFALASLPDWPKDTPILVYCAVGYRSEKVAEKLIAAGYTRVENLYGGIFEWGKRRRALVDSLGRATDTVHPYSDFWGRWRE